MSIEVPAIEKFIPINQLQAKALKVPRRGTLVDPQTGELWLLSRDGPTKIQGKRLRGDQLYGNTYIERLKLPNGFEIRTKQEGNLYELSVWLKYITISRRIVGIEGGESERMTNIEKRRLESLYGSLTKDKSEHEAELGLEWKAFSEAPPSKELSHQNSMPILLTLRTDEHSYNEKSRVILFAVNRNNVAKVKGTLEWSDTSHGWKDIELRFLGIEWAYLTPEVFDRLENCL